MTLRSGGYVYEPWGAVGVPAAGSRFHELVDRLGLGDEVEMIVPEGAMAESWFKGPDGTWRHSIGGSRQTDDPAGVDRLREMYGADDAGIEAMVRMFVDVMTLSDEQLDALDDVGMLEWMSGFGLPDGLVANLASSLNLLFVSPVNRIPVSEAARTLRQIVEGGAGRYHVGGYARVAEACTGYVERRGGRYLPGTDVEQVLVEGAGSSGWTRRPAGSRPPS
ncbi:MAG: hypothetical protein M5U14_12705 [Acidimicrobiia bacterium]|nr:hypothetical protein [Acidimicrobiia bacterium]